MGAMPTKSTSILWAKSKVGATGKVLWSKMKVGAIEKALWSDSQN